MEGQINSKIVGATVIGFALVAGAYTISNFGESTFPEPQPANIQATTPQQRPVIEVTDSDQNGIEDWRDVFVDTGTFSAPKTDEPYTPPTTVTGKTGIKFMEGMINSRLYAPFSKTQEEVVTNTVDSLDEVLDFKILEITDLDIMEEWDDQDIVNYANTVAATIIRHNDENVENELLVLNDILLRNNTNRVPELEANVQIYKNLAEDTQKIPVPQIFAKQHLDLINSYQALQSDVSAMIEIVEDPLLSFVYIKHYPTDLEGLMLSLENIYLALEEYTDLFTIEDPAVLFVNFSPDYKRNY
ncbi:hypothetical protein KC850_01965 [Candidatus Kaiserbacteria bacterium]|nr:hypothetical protein [Candidatus Kaiserbacteria bacterium]MCB9817948.1 hypothetical protein [Candidatus Nomurabacteria bacterium]